jgi:hypothetical protein
MFNLYMDLSLIKHKKFAHIFRIPYFQVKVKFSHYRSKQAVGKPEGYGYWIFSTFCDYEGNRVVTITYRPPLFPGDYPHPNDLATCPYLEPARSTPYPPSNFPNIHFILSSHLRLGIPTVPFPQVIPLNHYIQVFPPQYVFYVLLMSLFLTILSL